MMGRRSLAYFVLTSILFGGTFVAVKAGLEYFPPLAFVALRFDIAAAVLLVYVLLTVPREQIRPRTRGDVLGIFATGVLTIGLANALLFVGQQYVTSAVAAIVFSLNPILTPVFAAVLLADERLSTRGAVGMVLGLFGVVLVVGPSPALLLGGDVVGRVILLAGAVSGALGAVVIRRARTSVSSTVRTAWGLPFAAALTHGLSWSTGESMGAITWTPEAFAALAYVGLFAGALAYVLYFGLLDSAGAIRTNLLFYVVPAVSTLGGWVLLGETITALTVLGFLTIFAGFAVLGSESIELPSLPGGRRHESPADQFVPLEETYGHRSD